MLDPSAGLLAEPIRAEVLGGEGFTQLGHHLARSHGPPHEPGSSFAFVPRLQENLRVLRHAQRVLAIQSDGQAAEGPAAAWLQDNLLDVIAQTQALHMELPRSYYEDLPALRVEGQSGLPRIYAIAWHYLAHADGEVDLSLLSDLLNAYQQVHPLQLAELWALPTTLRVLLTENLRRLSERVAADAAARRLAHRLCDVLRQSAPAQAPLACFTWMKQRGTADTFALQVLQRLHADSDTGSVQGAAGREALRALLEAALPDPAAALESLLAHAAADSLSVSRSIGALNELARADWRTMITRCSPLVRQLSDWPPFAAEDVRTQDRTLHEIERLARRSACTQAQVAEQLLALATQTPPAPDGEPVESLGYWLGGRGAPLLQARLGLRSRAVRRSPAMRVTALLTVLATLSLMLVLGFLHGALQGPVGPGLWLLLAALALLPASEVSGALVNRVLSESIVPQRLPRQAFEAGIPATCRVLVVMPVLLDSLDTLDVLVRQLECHHLANREDFAQFGLLGDFADATSAETGADAGLLAHAKEGILALNQRHPGAADEPPRFLLLQRKRRWSPGEDCWMGWERKRGKLEALVSMLATGGASPFLDLGAMSRCAAGTRYVVTLDADTVMPPGALRELVAVAAHPLNRPRLGQRPGEPARVMAGHAILQPRLQALWPAVADGSLFHQLFAGAPAGHNAYGGLASDVYQDLFLEGSFCGKGLLDVAAVHQVLGQRLPDAQILSHDLIEGCIARCGSVNDVSFLEPAPQHADVASARLHRWTRGDWQLLPLMRQPSRYGLSLLDQWKLIDNLRRSLIAPASLMLLLLALGGAPLSPWAALGLAACAFGLAPLLGAVAGLAPSRDDVALVPFGRQALRELLRTALSVAWHLALWLQQAQLALDAIGRTLWRNGISHRGLLAWTTAADAERRASRALSAQLADKAPITLLAAGLGVALWALGTPAPALSLALCLSWAATPVWIALTARLPAPSPPPLHPEDRRYLLAVARETWAWFADQVNERSHHLPPDNVQTLPRVVVAQRTSPTNIGLYLLSATCAQAFGWLTPQELLSRLCATLDTLERLPMERGHLMNWIATDTLEPLMPAYVSTVDSGNLCGHLIAVAGACEALGTAQCPEDLEAGEDGGEPAALRRGLLAQARRCRNLAEATDFGFLYDPKRRLLHLGWRVAEQRLDPGHYDLLSSESRLASLWAIAKGDVPPAHWAALGRPFMAVGCEVGLRSWSGSLFEYLMPQLVLAEPPGSVLGCAARLAIAEQRRDARMRGQPWGVSESAYAATDRTLAYQYAPQGIASLAQRRTPALESVVAPYASAMAAMWDAAAATRNLARLQALHMRTCWGFYESLDFTPGRQRGGNTSTRVQTYMAHHQGMTLVALAQVLLDGQPRRWALSDARLAAIKVLLQEPVPREVPRRRRAPPDLRVQDEAPDTAPTERAVRPGEEVLARTHLLSNAGYREAGSPGSSCRPVYSVALRANGAGWSRYGGVDINRWRDDALRDSQGHFLYLRRPGEPAPVSLTQRPAPCAQAAYSARFLRDRVCFDALWPDLHARCTVWVCPEDDVEFRRVELWNTSNRALTLSLMSAFDASLSTARADEMHPAFAKLFVNARWDADAQALYLDRRPRTAEEEALHVVHFIAQTDAAGPAGATVLADRARWLGRLHPAWAPRAAFDDAPSPSGPLDTGLDPVAAMSVPLTLAAHGTVQCTWATAAATDMAALTALVDRHRQPGAVDRASQLSDTLHGLRQGEAQGDDDERRAIQALTSLLVLLHSRPVPAAQACDRRSLWRLGLSGERPLLVITVSSLPGLPLVQTLLKALRNWSQGGIGVDLVLINGEPLSYLKPVAQALRALTDASALDLLHGPAASRGGVVLLALDELGPVERSTLHLLARLRLNADGRPLARHVADIQAWHESLRGPEPSRMAAPTSPPQRLLSPPRQRPDEGFRQTDGAYAFSTSDDSPPWHPWVNVLANADFGTMVSERGAGWTWAGNSRLNQLSAWSNDPLTDAAREHYALQDLDTGEVWRLAGGDGPDSVERYVQHQPQGTRIALALGDLAVDMAWRVDAVLPLRRLQIILSNHGAHPRRLRLLGAIEWLMGTVMVDRQSVLTTHVPLVTPDAQSLDVMLATQLDTHDGDGGKTAFWALRACSPVDAGRPQERAAGAEGAGGPAGELDWTCDRRELIDRQGRQAWPSRFEGRAGLGIDPCAAAGQRLACAAGSSCHFEVLLGHGATAETALALASHALAAAPSPPHAALDAILVHSPDPLFDVLVNHWLLHQVTASRLWGRAGFYQAGGAFGFRDQLQDVMALVATAPQLVREHLLRAAARQFTAGDVQHWWHPHSGAGVRTRCSDDLLWLPHATLHYVGATQDSAVLEAQVPFLEGAPLAPDEDDAYTTPERTSETATLYEHCARALDARLQVGEHGLPLMGSGDWNDGMNRVGAGGRGESVWLGWFLCRIAADMTPLAARRGEIERVARWQAAAEGWRLALEGQAWAGHWYARAFFDDGTALGTPTGSECSIDLISQAWSVLSGVARPERQRHAMAAVERLLWDPQWQLLRLLDPPLSRQQPAAGYIQAYPPGVRENGGQYAHAVIWAGMAWARLGSADAVWRAWQCCSPAHRSADPVLGPRFGMEPYAVTADVCSQPPLAGRGGWSWYSGSAAGMYRLALESLCGLELNGSRLRFDPLLPSHWPAVHLRLLRHGRTWHFSLCRSDAAQAMAEAASEGARPLAVREWLVTEGAEGGTRYLVVLPPQGPA